MSITNAMSPTDAPSFVEDWLPGFDGTNFYTRTWRASPGPARAALLYVHGFADHISRNEHFFARWAAAGVTVFAYDMRGFGKTALDTAHRSAGAAYGKTSRALEVRDVEWWVEHLAKTYPDLPLFLMGYSAGGGLVLAFPTRSTPSPSPQTIAKLSGVISNAPLVYLSHRRSGLTMTVATWASKVLPYKTISAPEPEERFSQRPEVVEAMKKDPWRRKEGTLRGLADMINQGAELLATDWARWPKNLPLLMVHGTADEVNCPVAAEAFYNKLEIEDKKLVLYPDAFHDLINEAGNVPQQVMQEFISWTEAHIRGTPSGDSSS